MQIPFETILIFGLFLDLPIEGLGGSRLSRQEFTLNGIIF
jgi:hypothetical protein